VSDTERLKRLIYESGELSRHGENKRALRLLDDTITQAVRENNVTWVRILCRHAAVVCDHAGELDLVKQYSERILTYSPDDAMALYSLADVYLRQGRADAAKDYAAKCYQICEGRGSSEDRALIELLLKQWPDLQAHQK
jgi:tetratricopeptide (TPR) repeat protein